MSTIVTRSGKGAALTHVEVDANFTNLNTDKADASAVILATQKGAVSGVCPLDATSKVASTYLPSYVDDVLEYANYAALPATGETGKIYVALDTNKTYRWSGSAYIYITSGAVDSVAGKTGVVTLTATDVGLGNVTNNAAVANLSGTNTGDQALPTTLPASDVYTWAKAATKPTYTATEVGLGSANNTSDTTKPISTATQTALDLKSPLVSPTFTGTTTVANLAYTGTITGGTGVITIGTNQIYKDASGNVGIGTTSVSSKLTVAGAITITGAFALRGSYGAGAITSNFAAGDGALQGNTTGYYNSASGVNALFSNTTGYQNTASGVQALYTNTTGNYNTASGANALYYNTTGWYNTSSGVQALYNNTTGSNNVAVGPQALLSNTTGVATFGTITGGTLYTNGTYSGVAMSAVSGATFTVYPTVNITVAGGVVTVCTLVTAGTKATLNTAAVLTVAAALIGGTGSGFTIPVNTFAEGDNNSAMGAYALQGNTTGIDNSAMGMSALYTNTTGNYNTASGVNALYYITGSNNSAVGMQAGMFIADGSTPLTIVNNSTYLGYNTKASDDIVSDETVIGYNATGSGSHSITLGGSLVTKTIIPYGSVGIGYATPANTLHVANGVTTQIRVSTPTNNFYFDMGRDSVDGLFQINGNQGSGYKWLNNGTERMRIDSSGRVLIGTATASGTNLLQVSTDALIHGITVGSGLAGNNAVVGVQALLNNTTCTTNSAVGQQTLYATTSGSNNTSIGASTLRQNTIGINNVAVGVNALAVLTTSVATLGTVSGGTGYTNGTYTGVQLTLSSGSPVVSVLGTYPIATIVVAGGVVTTVTMTSFGKCFQDTTTILTCPAASIGGTVTVAWSVPVASLSTGQYNTAVGTVALAALTVGSLNTAIGSGAGGSITTGSNNVIIGSYSGAAAPISATGSNYIVLSDGSANVRQVIDSSGNVGIGTSSPNALLDVKKGATTFLPSNSSYYAASIYNAQNSATRYGLQVRTNWAAAENKVVSFGSVNAITGVDTEFFVVDGLGNVTLQANISVGGAAPTTVGTGITFPATQAASTNANTLDDYEEGAWTPVLTSGFTTTGTVTTAGTYTKIGRVVVITFAVSATSVSPASGAVMSGLPYPVVAFASLGSAGAGAGTLASMTITSSSSTLIFSGTAITPANLVGSITYVAAT